MLAETARAVVDRSCPPRSPATLDAGALEPQLWPMIVDAGWTEPRGLRGARRRGPGPARARRGVRGSSVAARSPRRSSRRRRSPRSRSRGWAPTPSVAVAAGLARGDRIGTLALLETGMRDEWDVPAALAGRRFRARRSSCRGRRPPTLLVVATAEGLRVVEPRCRDGARDGTPTPRRRPAREVDLRRRRRPSRSGTPRHASVTIDRASTCRRSRSWRTTVGRGRSVRSS